MPQGDFYELNAIVVFRAPNAPLILGTPQTGGTISP